MAFAYVAAVIVLALAALRPKFQAILEFQHESLDSLNEESRPRPSRRQPSTAADLKFEHASCLGKGLL
jgi:hypothetical protein